MSQKAKTRASSANAEISVEGICVTCSPVQLTVGNLASEDQGLELLKKYATRQVESSWYIGDLLLALEAQFGKKADRRLTKKLGLDYGTIANRKSVARKVPVSLRNEKLSWEHHRVVSKLKTAEDKQRWLDWAEKEGKTTRELAGAINGLRPPKGIPGAKTLLRWLEETAVLNWPEWDSDKRKDVLADLQPIVDGIQKLTKLDPSTTTKSTKKMR
jgi:hypothetical protein